jgi:hypothetical protein
LAKVATGNDQDAVRFNAEYQAEGKLAKQGPSCLASNDWIGLGKLHDSFQAVIEGPEKLRS